MKIAGISVTAGVQAELLAKAEGMFDAQAEFNYYRKVKAKGVVAMHSVGLDSIPDTGFDYSEYDSQDESSEPPGSLDVEIDATAKMSLIPRVYVGIFAEAGSWALSGDAEAYVAAQAELMAQARFQLGTRLTSDVTCECEILLKHEIGARA